MSYHFKAYKFLKRDLWQVVDTLRSYLAASHRYAYAAQLVSIDMYRQKLSGREHANFCNTNYLGECSCDFWRRMKRVRDYVTGKSTDQNGLEAQLVSYGIYYVMRIVGEYYWYESIPDELMKHLSMSDASYFDSAEPSREMRLNKKVADHFNAMVNAHHYMNVPLLTVDDMEHMMWDLAMFLVRRIHAQRKVDVTPRMTAHIDCDTLLRDNEHMRVIVERLTTEMSHYDAGAI